MPKPTLDQVRSHLSSFGVAIDNFNQSENGRGFGSADLKEGYCEGVALDWIRRVLQGGRPSFSANKLKGSNPNYNFLQKKQSQAARQAHAFLNWAPTLERVQQRQAPRVKDMLVAEWNQKKSIAIQKYEDLEDDLLSILEPATTAQVALTPEVLEKIKQCFGYNLGRMENANTVERLYRAIPSKIAAINDRRIDAQATLDKVRIIVRAKAWDDFSDATDEVLPKKRSFKNLALLSSSALQQGLDLKGVLGKLMDVGTNDLKNDRAVKINLGGKQEGRLFYHSTASYLDPGLAKPYLFLDPNYGIFAYSEWKLGVMKAIAYLYTRSYNWIEDNPDRDVPITKYDLAVEVFGRRS